MARSNRSAFTLVEMLVVIAIIGVLAAMLLPAVQYARELASRAECNNNQAQVTKAILMFADAEGHNGRLPGWREQVGANVRPWSVAIMPFMDNKNLRDTFKNLAAGTNPADIPYLPYMVCPSDAIRYVTDDLNRRDTSYVGNAGMAASEGAEHYSHGVMHDYVGTRMRTRIDDIQDGKTYTALISENSGATRYWDLAPFQSHPSSPYQKAANVFVWFKQTPPANNARHLNFEPRLTIPAAAPYNDEDLARPSSYHTGGVVMGFADGHTQFILEGIDYDIYRQIMTPWGKTSSTLAGTMNPPVSAEDL